MKRRQFLKNSIAGAVAPVAMAPVAGLAAPNYNEEILVHIFLRGGIDGLNVVVPLDEHDHEYYSIMRPTLSIPDTGPGAALPIAAEPFGFNPLAAPLKELYDSGLLAVVQAVGTPDDISSRSHFDAEKYIELGTPGNVGTSTGWLHRHFISMTQSLNQYPEEILLPIIAFRNNPPVSLLGNTSTLTFNDPGVFRLDSAHWRWNLQDDDWIGEKGYMQLEMIPRVYNLRTDEFSVAGSQALLAEDVIRTRYNPEYVSSGGVGYQGDNIARQLSDVAQLIKMDNGTRIFPLDYHNFDSHANQNNPDAFDNLLDNLARALVAFFDDLDNSGGGYADRTTVILQSEFGRRAFQNNSNGTDHGNGNIMIAIGRQVNGGKLYGTWPGLYPGTADEWVDYANPKNGSTEPELFEGALATTTDFRQVLGEYLFKRCAYNNDSLNFVFPAFSGYAPLGVFKTPDTIFRSGFEAGS
jgi:uncharacterized protein (DUF1501 family)